MPPVKYELELTIGEVIPPEPVKELKVAPEGVPYPHVFIYEFTATG